MTAFIQAAAEQDILRQVEWYAAQGLPDIARRFLAAATDAVAALEAMPNAGPPRHSTNPEVAGLRTWPIKGFDEVRIYYLARADALTVVRILHDRRDIGAILTGQKLEKP